VSPECVVPSGALRLYDDVACPDSVLKPAPNVSCATQQALARVGRQGRILTASPKALAP